MANVDLVQFRVTPSEFRVLLWSLALWAHGESAAIAAVPAKLRLQAVDIATVDEAKLLQRLMEGM